MFFYQWKKQYYFGISFLFFNLLFMGLPTVVQANTFESKFSVQAILPESQIEQTQAYFDLLLDEGEEETLKVRIFNASSEPISIQVSAHTAFTNVNGVVEWDKDAPTPDPTLKYSLAELMEVPDIITLEPGQSQEVSIQLVMPPERFEGVLAAGLRIQEISDDEKETEANQGFSIRNEVSFEIGVIARNDRASVTPDLELLDVFADQLNYRNVFSATVQNFMPTFVNQLEIQAQIRAKGEDKILYAANRKQMAMAPNSHFNFPISLNGDPFQSGDYLLTMTARSGDLEWSWEEEFTVDARTARQLNREDVTIDNSINWWLIGSIGLGSLLLILIAYLLRSLQVLKKQNQNENK